jgi:hypothetical protein
LGASGNPADGKRAVSNVPDLDAGSFGSRCKISGGALMQRIYIGHIEISHAMAQKI